jgi:hypothetical protein
MTAILPPDIVVDEFNNPERLEILIIEAVAAHVRKLRDDEFFRQSCQYAADFADAPGMPVPPTRQELVQAAEVIERAALVLREEYACRGGWIEGLEW